MTLGSRLNRFGRRGGEKREAGQSEYPRQRQIIGSQTGQVNPLTMAVDGVICDALRVSRGSVPSTIF